MVSDISVDITTLFVLLAMFCVLADERLLVKGGCPLQDGGRSTGISHTDEGYLTDERVLCHCQNDPKVAVMEPSTGNLDRRRVCGEEMVCVSDVRVVRFPWLLWERWGREAVSDGVDQLGVCHFFFSLASEC